MFNETTMCGLEEEMRLDRYNFKTPLSWAATITAWLFVYAQPLYNLYQRVMLSPNDMRLVFKLLFDITRFVLLPMLYAYIWRATPAPTHITIQAPCTDRETMTSDDLDTIDKSILLSLSRNPSGCTARMIHQRIGPMYPELEKEDIAKRLESLTSINRAAILPTNLSSVMWIPIKVKAQ